MAAQQMDVKLWNRLRQRPSPLKQQPKPDGERLFMPLNGEMTLLGFRFLVA